MAGTATWFARLRQSCLACAISAAANATASGMYASAVGLQRSCDSTSGLVNIAGTVALYTGLLAALASLILLISAVEDLRVRWLWMNPRSWKVFSTLGLVGLVVLGLAAAIYVGSATALTFERAWFIAVAFQAVCAVAAAIFSGALASLPLTLSAGIRVASRWGRSCSRGVGFPGEMAVDISNSMLYGPTSSNILTFGGFPLVNLNLPFGAIVAVSAGLMWVAYRQLSPRPEDWSTPMGTMSGSAPR